MELVTNPIQRSNPLLQSFKSAIRFSQIPSDFQLGSHIHIWFRTLTQFSRNPEELQGAFRLFARSLELANLAEGARGGKGAEETERTGKPKPKGEEEDPGSAPQGSPDAAEEYREKFGFGPLPGEARPHIRILLFLCPAEEKGGRGWGRAAAAARSDPRTTEALEPALRSASLVCFHFRASLVPCFSFQQAALALQECKRFVDSPAAVFSLRPRAPDNLQALSDLFRAVPGMNRPKILELCRAYPSFRDLCLAARGYLGAEEGQGGPGGPGGARLGPGTVSKTDLEHLPNFSRASAVKLAATLFGTGPRRGGAATGAEGVAPKSRVTAPGAPGPQEPAGARVDPRPANPRSPDIGPDPPVPTDALLTTTQEFPAVPDAARNR